VEQETNQYNAPNPAGAPRPVPESPPAVAGPHANPRAGYAPESPVKKRWWSTPKILVAAGVAVLLASGGGVAIGYSVGKSEAAQQFSQRFQNGRPNGAGGQSRRSPGPGQAQPTAPATPGSSNNP
jgi:hypothetical protein